MQIIEKISDWVLVEAISKAANWQKEFGRSFVISIDVSVYQLERENFVNRLSEILTQYEYNPNDLELEVSENKITGSSREFYANLKAIKTLGIKIALNDFGTGYSSLDYLRWLPFDVLKIDKSFIDHLDSDTIERKIVHSVIALVNKLNLETVAEGVENDEQLQSLQDTSCTYVQGYLFSEPLNDFNARELLLDMD